MARKSLGLKRITYKQRPKQPSHQFVKSAHIQSYEKQNNGEFKSSDNDVWFRGLCNDEKGHRCHSYYLEEESNDLVTDRMSLSYKNNGLLIVGCMCARVQTGDCL